MMEVSKYHEHSIGRNTLKLVALCCYYEFKIINVKIDRMGPKRMPGTSLLRLEQLEAGVRTRWVWSNLIIARPIN